MSEFKNWRDIRNWAERNGFENIVRRMELNNACWNSSGEFGRSQVAICDAIRFADEEERLAVAEEIETELAEDIVLQCVA